jgi:hypothetical protein
MRTKIIDFVARALGVLVHIDGLPYERSPRSRDFAAVANPCTAPSASPPNSAAFE